MSDKPHGLYGTNVKPGTKQFGAKRRSELVQEPVFAFFGLVLATITFAAVQARFPNPPLQRPEHVVIRLAMVAEDQCGTRCTFPSIFQQPSQQVIVNRNFPLLKIF